MRRSRYINHNAFADRDSIDVAAFRCMYDGGKSIVGRIDIQVSGANQHHICLLARVRLPTRSWNTAWMAGSGSP